MNIQESVRLKIMAAIVPATLVSLAAMGYALYKIIDLVFGLRASTEDEQRGLDYSEHYEVGYPEFGQQQVHGGVARDTR